LSQTLASHGLIDEYRLMIDSLIIGVGKRLFPENNTIHPFRLTSCQTTTTGAILASYTRADQTADAPA